MEQTAEQFVEPTAMLRSEMPSHCPVQSISWLVLQKSWDEERRFWLVICFILHTFLVASDE